jgi:hypothetical protein
MYPTIQVLALLKATSSLLVLTVENHVWIHVIFLLLQTRLPRLPFADNVFLSVPFSSILDTLASF